MVKNLENMGKATANKYGINVSINRNLIFQKCSKTSTNIFPFFCTPSKKHETLLNEGL